jgi:isocitrate lyase
MFLWSIPTSFYPTVPNFSSPTSSPPQQTSHRKPQKFAAAIHAKFPGKLLAYNCSPSFNWKKRLNDGQIESFQQDLGALGEFGDLVIWA